MASQRRIGSEDSETRVRLVDAAEELLRSRGHVAVTVRSIAEHAGLKRQLVHYYFHSMEDLFVEVVRRASTRYLNRQQEALRAPNPLRALWKILSASDGIRLEIEFMALANQFESIRALVGELSSYSRDMQVSALRSALPDAAGDPLYPDVEAIPVLFRGIARAIAMEAKTGLTRGHSEAEEFIEQILQRFETAGSDMEPQMGLAEGAGPHTRE